MSTTQPAKITGENLVISLIHLKRPIFETAFQLKRKKYNAHPVPWRPKIKPLKNNTCNPVRGTLIAESILQTIMDFLHKLTQINNRNLSVMSRKTLLSLAAGVFFTPFAFAHPDHAQTLTGGFAHVFTGFDHMLSMLVLGVWAACLTKPLQRAISLLVPAILLVGFIVGTAFEYSVISLADKGIMASLILAGVLIASRLRFQGKNLIQMSLAIVFAVSFLLFHGIAHTEVTTRFSANFVIGLISASVVLQQLGLSVGKFLFVRLPAAHKYFGTIVSLAGLGIVGASIITG